MPISNTRDIRGSCSGEVPIERRRRDAEAVRDLSDPDIGIGEQRPRDIKVVFCQLWRSTAGATGAPRRREARLGALPDQAALEFR